MLRFLNSLTLAAAFSALPIAAAAHDQHSAGKTAPGPSAGYAFSLPEPGSYRLPPIKPAAGGNVLDENGRQQELLSLLKERITVLAFMYTRCGDACPTATLQMSVLQDLAAKDKPLSGRIRLISMSFDPDHDVPGVMAEHAALWRSSEAGAPEWLFLTAPDRTTLAPMLSAYDQSVAPKPDPEAAGGPLHHIFRAFLIDPTGQIRNIYSLDFLDPELVLNDIKTLVMQLDREGSSAPAPK